MSIWTGAGFWWDVVFQSVGVGRVFHQLSMHIDLGATEGDCSRDVRIPGKNSLWPMWMEFPIEMRWSRWCWFMVKILMMQVLQYLLLLKRIVVIMTFRELPCFSKKVSMMIGLRCLSHRFLPASSPLGSVLCWYCSNHGACLSMLQDGRRHRNFGGITAWLGKITLNHFVPIKTLWQM